MVGCYEMSQNNDKQHIWTSGNENHPTREKTPREPKNKTPREGKTPKRERKTPNPNKTGPGWAGTWTPCAVPVAEQGGRGESASTSPTRNASSGARPGSSRWLLQHLWGWARDTVHPQPPGLTCRTKWLRSTEARTCHTAPGRKRISPAALPWESSGHVQRCCVCTVSVFRKILSACECHVSGGGAALADSRRIASTAYPIFLFTITMPDAGMLPPSSESWVNGEGESYPVASAYRRIRLFFRSSIDPICCDTDSPLPKASRSVHACVGNLVSVVVAV